MSPSKYETTFRYADDEGSKYIGRTIHVKLSGLRGTLLRIKQRDLHSSFSLHAVLRLTLSGLTPPADVDPSSPEFKQAALPLVQKDTQSKVQDRLAEDEAEAPSQQDGGEPVWVRYRPGPRNVRDSIAFLAFGQMYEMEDDEKHWDLHITPVSVDEEISRMASYSPCDSFATQGAYMFRIGWTTKSQADFEALLVERLGSRGQTEAEYKEFFDIVGRSVLSRNALDADWLSVITGDSPTAKRTAGYGPPAAVASTWAARLSLVRSRLGGADEVRALDGTLAGIHEHVREREAEYVESLADDLINPRPRPGVDKGYNPLGSLHDRDAMALRVVTGCYSMGSGFGVA
ncbi:hypothetical protein N3K66_006361 [Trichothecium roseum]|uniref:Uncharacterized protein n=1 Tax=Trichothecium roseum TaxID=47278 RepID=A0ACC0UV61_9HYPO|nr:hypothetical protein N3K66_006361 [Trichothecium roseum]